MIVLWKLTHKYLMLCAFLGESLLMKSDIKVLHG